MISPLYIQTILHVPYREFISISWLIIDSKSVDWGATALMQGSRTSPNGQTQTHHLEKITPLWSAPKNVELTNP